MERPRSPGRVLDPNARAHRRTPVSCRIAPAVPSSLLGDAASHYAADVLAKTAHETVIQGPLPTTPLQWMEGRRSSIAVLRPRPLRHSGRNNRTSQIRASWRGHRSALRRTRRGEGSEGTCREPEGRNMGTLAVGVEGPGRVEPDEVHAGPGHVPKAGLDGERTLPPRPSTTPEEEVGSAEPAPGRRSGSRSTRTLPVPRRRKGSTVGHLSTMRS